MEWYEEWSEQHHQKYYKKHRDFYAEPSIEFVEPFPLADDFYYVGDRLVGILLADMNGEEKIHRSFGKVLYEKLFDLLQKKFCKGPAGLYEETMKQMVKEYAKQNRPDGKICFLATDPKAKMRGVGSMMLLELEKREPGKTVYLHTDDACVYQFYEKRGFDRVCETEIELNTKTKQIPLKCFVYSKKLWEG